MTAPFVVEIGYLAAVRVSVDVAGGVVEAVTVDTVDVQPDVQGLLFEAESGRLLSPGDDVVRAAYAVAGSAVWPAWQIGADRG